MYYGCKNVLVVEDNEANMEVVCRILTNIGPLNIFKALDIEMAYKYAMEYDIDVFIVDFILDIHTLGDISGIRFIENIRKIDKYKFSPIIVTTCLEDPKLNSYIYLHCYRYFEKPYDEEEFERTVIQALEYIPHKEKKKRLYYKNDGILFSIKIEDIIYVVNHSLYIEYHCVDEVHKAPYKSCKKILEEINSDDFIQCSKSTIVNVNYILNVDFVNRYITLINEGEVLEIGSRMKKHFMSRLKND